MQKEKNLLSLQNLIKRSPESYVSEFESNLLFYKSLFESFKLSLSRYDKELAAQVIFISHVSHCYPEQVRDFPDNLCSLLSQHSAQMDTEMRLTFCKALILLRNKGIASPLTLLQLFLKLFKCQDKLLRKTLANYIIQDIKQVNCKHRNARLNTSLQNLLFTAVQEDSAASKQCLTVMTELYRRQVWRDAKTVNIIASCCFSKIPKILLAALNFFLGAEEADKDSSDEEDDPKTTTSEAKKIKLNSKVTKKTRKRQKKMQRELAALKKHRKKKTKPEVFNNSALHLLHDPQTFAEKLLKQLEKTGERFEVRLLMLDLISRLIGLHSLQVLAFYPFIQRYLTPRQAEVTRILLFCAQASHSLVPPECLEPCVRSIADNFVTDRASAEAIAVGLNSIREILARAPYAISQELLSDLVEYVSYRDKNVTSAARSLISLFRGLNPHLLHKKHRGRPNQAETEGQNLEFGQSGAKDYLPGAEEVAEDPDDDEEAVESDSDESWVDLDVSEGEEVKDGEEKPEDPEELKLKARLVSNTRILSQRDFEKMERAQVLKRTQGLGKNRKRPGPQEPPGPGETVSLSDITRLAKRPKMNKQERLASAQEGREGRPKFSSGPRRLNPQASTTNKEKRKTKTFGMIKHKAKAKKSGRSFREKQVAFRDALVKRLKKAKR